MRHLIKWLLAVAIVQAGLLLLLAWILPGFHIGSLPAAVVAALIFAVANVVVWPLIYDVAARFNALLFPLLCFALEGGGVLLLSRLVPDFGGGGMDVDGLGAGIAIAVGLTLGNTVVGALFSLQDDDAYDRFVTRRLRRHFGDTPRSDVPGILFLEIDGLAEPILRRAIAAGSMPTLGRWLDSGSHTLTGWEPDLSSQTSASQAGILLGDNAGIPAFRWYDKPSQKLMVSSHMSTARELEQRLTNGQGLLIAHGGSRWNVFSGDAPDCLCTYSTFGDRSRTVSGSYLAYFSDPFTLPRTVALFACDVVRERYQAWQQRRQDVRPRIAAPGSTRSSGRRPRR